MTLAVMVLLAIGGGGPSLHLVEMTADRCLWGEALRMLDEVPASVQRTRAAQMVRARLLVQLERGGQAVAILTSLPPRSGRRKADRLMLLELAFSAANDLHGVDPLSSRRATGRASPPISRLRPTTTRSA